MAAGVRYDIAALSGANSGEDHWNYNGGLQTGVVVERHNTAGELYDEQWQLKLCGGAGVDGAMAASEADADGGGRDGVRRRGLMH